MEYTYNDLPKAISLLVHEVSQLKQLLQEKSSLKSTSSQQWLDLNELCRYLPDKPAKATVYAWVSKSLIPYHKGGKRLRFSKVEIDTWLNGGGSKTDQELDSEAHLYLAKTRK
ncbi:MAG: DNA-binding protein [Bacteroidetes bacterium]|nr:MAG: DNA-binding protein [Bacteroidota bacterium]